VVLVGCAANSPAGTPAGGDRPGPSTTIPRTPVAGNTAVSPRSRPTKVMVILEENKTYRQVLRSGRAPYLTRLAATYGSATAMDAGYPRHCPSLAAYLILTSGSDHQVCDDDAPEAHRLPGDSVFQQVTTSGRQWRSYAESMPANCTTRDAADGLYLVRHSPATYYTNLRSRCAVWHVPLGTTSAGPLRADVRAGTLPAYSFVTPNACNDMHGGPRCPSDQVAAGDAWLARWIPVITSGADFRRGRLAVIITWDEGSPLDNHIPTLVLSTRTHSMTTNTPATHCSTLRTVEEILDLPLLGCAADAGSLRPDFAR
jgi:phosphatidylinositol-3-phosphatase